MFPYFVTIASSFFLFGLSETERAKDRVPLAVILEAAGIVILCVLAGARDYGIGTDTKGYGIWLFNLALQQENLIAFMHSALNSTVNMDFLFALQAYVVVRLTDSIFWYYFAIEAVMLIPLYLSVKELVDSSMVAPCMLLYLILFYIPGYNAMRQFIAMSFVLLSFAKLYHNKRFVSGVLFICAVLYHSSAIIGLIPLISWVIFFKQTGDGIYTPRRLSKISAFPCFVALSIAIANSINLIGWLTSVIPAFDKFRYTLSYSPHSYLSGYVFFGFLLLMLVLLAYRTDSLKRGVVIFLICMVGLYFPLFSLQVYSQALQRLSSYMLLFAVPLLGMVGDSGKSMSQIKVTEAAVYACAVAMFIWVFAINGSHEAIPYSSYLFAGV